MFYLYHGNKFTIIATATDDFTVIVDSTEGTNHLIQKQLTECFEIPDLRPINWLLGVSIMHNLKAKTISLSQQAYFKQIIAQFGLQDACSTVTPMEPRINLSLDSPTISPMVLTPAEKKKVQGDDQMPYVHGCHDMS